MPETALAQSAYINDAVDLDDETLYPATDGKPMGETDWHIKLLGRLLDALDRHFRDEPDVYVAADNLIYYERGNVHKFVVPDLYVVRGVEKRMRRLYRVWVEGRTPDFILELLSGESARRDKVEKLAFYRDVFQTEEYFLHNPLPESRELLGYRLIAGEYRPLKPDARGRLTSRVLDLQFGVDDEGTLRVYLPTGEPLPFAEDLQRATREMAAEIERLRKLLGEMGA
jgi:Uma2 family endonuclease